MCLQCVECAEKAIKQLDSYIVSECKKTWSMAIYFS